MNSRRFVGLTCSALAVLAIGAGLRAKDASARGERSSVTADLQSEVQTIVVIYAENRSFDNLYGNFPNANGLSSVVGADGKPLPAYVPQRDRDGNVLTTLPRVWHGVTEKGQLPVVTEAESAGLPNAPFSIETAFPHKLSTSTVTRDLWHRFYEHQMQIDGGKNDMFAAWTDAGALTMGHFDYSGSKLYKLAQQYVLADNFFQGAFGGSFLNHQYLICACAPEYPHADQAPAKPSITKLNTDANGKYLPVLAPGATPNAAHSALDGPPSFALSGNIAPANYFGDGKFYAINTMQPPYQPSLNKPLAGGGTNSLYADSTRSTTLPPQTAVTIGDRLNAKKVSWKWYGGSWNLAVADGEQDPTVRRNVIYTAGPDGATPEHPDFQAHHQPFNYYAAFDPVRHAADRAAHLKDYNDLVADAAAGTLPQVSFYKPEGEFNQHEGETNLADGDAKIAELVAKLQAGPQWKNMVIVITYDEFGGTWDHVAPPRGDLLGPGTRIPAIVISPMAKKGVVDHTQYDTGSILRFISRRFGLDVLPGVAARDKAIKDAGGVPMGDLSAALTFK